MFKNSYQAWVRQAIFGSALLLVVASCGSAENDDTAYEASGGQSFPVTVTCDSGSSVTVDVPSDDEGQIDDHLNSIDPCENDGGYASVNFTGCQNSDPRTVTIDANNGAIPDFDTLDYCEA